MIQIEKGVPLPKVRVSIKLPWDELRIGDSFIVERGYQAMHTAAKARGMKITTRKQPDGTVRVWRIA